MKLGLINNGDKPLVAKNPKRPWWDWILEQLVNAFLTAIIAFLAVLLASGELNLKVALIAGGIALVPELRKILQYWPKK